MRGSPAHHVWHSPVNCCFISAGQSKPTQSAVITLEILHVTMEAFVSALNGLPDHSFTSCAESIFRLFSFISYSAENFGTMEKEISGGQLLLIVFLQCCTICLLELSGVIDAEYRYPFVSFIPSAINLPLTMQSLITDLLKEKKNISR